MTESSARSPEPALGGGGRIGPAEAAVVGLGPGHDVLDVDSPGRPEPAPGVRSVDAAEAADDAILDGLAVPVVAAVVRAAPRFGGDDQAVPGRVLRSCWSGRRHGGPEHGPDSSSIIARVRSSFTEAVRATAALSPVTSSVRALARGYVAAAAAGLAGATAPPEPLSLLTASSSGPPSLRRAPRRRPAARFRCTCPCRTPRSASPRTFSTARKHPRRQEGGGLTDCPRTRPPHRVRWLFDRDIQAPAPVAYKLGVEAAASFEAGWTSQQQVQAGGMRTSLPVNALARNAACARPISRNGNVLATSGRISPRSM